MKGRRKQIIYERAKSQHKRRRKEMLFDEQTRGFKKVKPIALRDIEIVSETEDKQAENSDEMV